MNEDIKKYLSSIGKRGGETTRLKHGTNYFSRIAKLRHKKAVKLSTVKRLAEKS